MKNPPRWVSWRERRGVRARHLIFHPMRWDCGFDTGATPLMLRDRKFLRRSCVPWFRIEMHEVPLVLVPLVLVLCGLLLVKLQLLTLSRIHNDSTDPRGQGSHRYQAQLPPGGQRPNQPNGRGEQSCGRNHIATAGQRPRPSLFARSCNLHVHSRWTLIKRVSSPWHACQLYEVLHARPKRDLFVILHIHLLAVYKSQVGRLLHTPWALLRGERLSLPPPASNDLLAWAEQWRDRVRVPAACVQTRSRFRVVPKMKILENIPNWPEPQFDDRNHSKAPAPLTKPSSILDFLLRNHRRLLFKNRPTLNTPLLCAAAEKLTGSKERTVCT